MGNTSNADNTLKEVEVEDYIWIIYIFIAIFAIISNHYEKEYIKKHKNEDEKNFRTINTTIFIITFFIYLYFVYINYKHLKQLDPRSSSKQVFFANAGFIVAVIFLIGGIGNLLISIFGEDEDEFLLNFF